MSQPEADAPEVQEIWGIPFGASRDSVTPCPDHPLGEETRGLLRSKRRTLAQTTAPPTPHLRDSPYDLISVTAGFSLWSFVHYRA
jgi:hypothetical protein